jgi:hypothetical protein
MNYYPLIARKLERDPALVKTAMATLNHWSRLGNIPQTRVRQWRRILHGAMRSGKGFRELLKILRDDSEKGARLKDFGPFAGLLSREERRKVFLKCVYSH